MKSSSKKKISLHERLEKVEKQNQRMKTYMILLSITFLALAAIGAKEATQDGHFRQITAEGITISGFRYVVPGTAPGLNCLAMNVGETRYNLLRLSSWLYF